MDSGESALAATPHEHHRTKTASLTRGRTLRGCLTVAYRRGVRTGDKDEQSKTFTGSKRKRAQIELMGLLLIVLLVAVILLFVLYFVLSDATQNTTVEESILAQNTITTLRKTQTNCHGRTVEELLEDCARTGGAIECAPGINTCKKADLVMNDILTALFGELGREYFLSLRGIPHFITLTYGSPCSRGYESKEQPLPVGIAYDVFLRLDICNG